MTREEFFYQCIDVIEHWLNGTRKISDLREVTDKLYNEVTKPYWISVEDELPEDDREVACLTADGELYLDRYVRGTRYGNIWCKTEKKPIKWLPLKPKKGGNQ